MKGKVQEMTAEIKNKTHQDHIMIVMISILVVTINQTIVSIKIHVNHLHKEEIQDLHRMLKIDQTWGFQMNVTSSLTWKRMDTLIQKQIFTMTLGQVISMKPLPDFTTILIL